MELKWTITVGELIQILSILLGGFTVYNRLSLELRDLKTKIEPLWDQYTNERERDTNNRNWKRLSEGN